MFPSDSGAWAFKFFTSKTGSLIATSIQLIHVHAQNEYAAAVNLKGPETKYVP